MITKDFDNSILSCKVMDLRPTRVRTLPQRWERVSKLASEHPFSEDLRGKLSTKSRAVETGNQGANEPPVLGVRLDVFHSFIFKKSLILCCFELLPRPLCSLTLLFYLCFNAQH